MKKGLCIMLSALMIALSFAACGKKTATDEPTKVDENGSAYVELTDKDGNEVTSVLSDKEKKNADKKASKDNKTTTTESYSELVSQISDMGNSISNIKEDDIKSDKKDLISDGTEIKKTTLHDDVINKVIKSGKFTIKMKLKAASNADTPMTLVSNGKKLATDMTVSGVQVRMIMDDSGVNVAFPSLKLYMQLSSEDTGSIEDFKNIGSTDQTYVGSSKVKSGGVEYVCEEYKASDGTIMKYYFSGNNWKRLETISGDEVAILEIESFTGKADESVFSLAGYSDMTPLLGSMDSVTTTTKKK